MTSPGSVETVLVLGGTSEARALAAALAAAGVDVLTSLAGRVARPALPVGRVRVGGFGGVEGLRRALAEQSVGAVVDATHPFAARISGHAALACAASGVALLRLERPGWARHPRSGEWTWVTDVAAAVAAGAAAHRPFLTTGRQSLEAFLPWSDRAVTVRVVDPPEVALPPSWRVICSRGPYDYPAEHGLLRELAADLLVTKDSGGAHTVAKLDAAADLGVAVLVVRRPAAPAGVPTVATVEQALGWVLGAQASESAQARCRSA